MNFVSENMLQRTGQTYRRQVPGPPKKHTYSIITRVWPAVQGTTHSVLDNSTRSPWGLNKEGAIEDTEQRTNQRSVSESFFSSVITAGHGCQTAGGCRFKELQHRIYFWDNSRTRLQVSSIIYRFPLSTSANMFMRRWRITKCATQLESKNYQHITPINTRTSPKLLKLIWNLVMELTLRHTVFTWNIACRASAVWGNNDTCEQILSKLWQNCTCWGGTVSFTDQQ